MLHLINTHSGKSLPAFIFLIVFQEWNKQRDTYQTKKWCIDAASGLELFNPYFLELTEFKSVYAAVRVITYFLTYNSFPTVETLLATRKTITIQEVTFLSLTSSDLHIYYVACYVNRVDSSTILKYVLNRYRYYISPIISTFSSLLQSPHNIFIINPVFWVVLCLCIGWAVLKKYPRTLCRDSFSRFSKRS